MLESESQGLLYKRNFHNRSVYICRLQFYNIDIRYCNSNERYDTGIMITRGPRISH